MAKDEGKSVAPPKDLAERKLWLRAWQPKVFWRIHDTANGPCYFSEGVGSRFSSPGMGVLYLGDEPDTAFWEVFWDRIADCRHDERRVSRADLEGRGICTASIRRPLRLFNATSPRPMKSVSAPTATFSSDYGNCQAWARVLFTHPEKPDGILYPSARTSGAKCLALFVGRVSCKDITFSSSTPLPDRVDLMNELVTANVAVIR